MKNSNNKFEEIQQTLGRMKDYLHILETNVPVEMQMEYFRFSGNIRNDTAAKSISIEDQIKRLNAPDLPEIEKKYYMVALAHSADVLAYRALESYVNHLEPELKDWAAMALMEARVALEAELSDEKRIFISTGLGGQGSKLRFFALLKSKKLKSFSPYQKNLVEREFLFQIEKNEGIVEELTVEENYITLIFLIEVNINLKQVLDNSIAECNQYGNFVDLNYLITNVKIYNREEIQKELEKSANES
jgi:hypothetical protein